MQTYDCVLLAALIERIDLGIDEIRIRLRPTRLGAPLNLAATALPSAIETQILSVPARLGRYRREIKLLIDGSDPFAMKKDEERRTRPSCSRLRTDMGFRIGSKV
jgi:hypothetical protein